jgi:hypothetical protein
MLFRMIRRFIAVFAALALAVAFLPAATDGWSASVPDCCNSALCPMMHHAGALCDMATHRQGASFDSCPSPAPHYLAAYTFVRVAPPEIAAEQPAGRALVFAAPAGPHQDFDVASPPPRLSLP